MSMVRNLCVSCVVCLLASATAWAQPPAAVAGPPTPAAAPAQLSDRLRSQQGRFEIVSEHHWRFVGQVEQEWDGQTKFFAEQIDLYTDTSTLVATGNVVFRNAQGHVAAERVEFDLQHNTGTFYDASGLMPLGSAADSRQFGDEEADVYFWGNVIERVSDRQYRITQGGFTTCVQPTPRWELTTGTLLLNLDDYAIARSTVLRVKGVPLLYLPVVYYPIQDDDRATGFLLPTYGASTLRGGAISNAFFWAISRSQDATFFHDWFTRTGQGVGTEYRYVAAAQSAGAFRVYWLDQNETVYEDNGQTTTLPASQSFALTGSMNHALTRRVRARARLDYFSDVVTQQLYNQNVYQASRNNRVIEGALTAALGPTSNSVLYQRNELIDNATNSTVYGSTPRISSSLTPQALFGSPVYASVNAEYAFQPYRAISDGVVTRDSGFSRTDLSPVVRVPLSRLSYLSVNTSASYRTTYYSRSLDDEGNTVDEPYLRQYASLRSEVVGPVFTRIWDRPTSAYAERLKHVIEPAFTVDVTSQFADYTSTPVVSDVSDIVVSGATRFTYGVTNRFFARGRAAQTAGRGQTREFVTVGLQQTYYSNPESARYDSTYQSTYGYSRPLDLSPVALSARVSPTSAVDGNLRIEYDSTGLGMLMLSAGGSLNAGSASTSVNYSRRQADDSNYLSVATTMRWFNGRANGTYGLSWDISRSYIVSQTVMASYLAQCCGLQLEFQRFNYPGVEGSPLPADTRFNFGFILAGLGTFSNFFGAFGGLGQP